MSGTEQVFEDERGTNLSLMAVLFALAMILALRLIYLCLADPLRFPIARVKIIAPFAEVSHDTINRNVAPFFENVSFFTLPTFDIERRLRRMPWVKYASVERIWPDKVKIFVREREAVAYWNAQLLDSDGQVFGQAAQLKNMQLPKLAGPMQESQEVLQVYKKLSNILTTYGLHAATLEKRDNQAWVLRLANEVTLQLGKQDLETRILRFCKAYPAVFANKSDRLVSVDLRYPRGMAVQWKN